MSVSSEILISRRLSRALRELQKPYASFVAGSSSVFRPERHGSEEPEALAHASGIGMR